MNKGFTLIELLGVITILVLIFMLTIPAVNKVIKSSENTVYDYQINKILDTTYDYSLKHLSLLPNKYEKKYITLSELIYNANLEPPVNPTTDELFPEDYLISIENVGKKYVNHNKYAKKIGSYLYKLEIEEMEDQNYIANKPQIYLEGLSRNNNSYTTRINQGAVFDEIEPTIYDSDSNVITNAKVTKNILFEDKVVDFVNTSKIGIYKINYSAMYEEDNKTYANVLTWNIIITDTEAPILIMPANSTISTNAETFDLMEGVKCIDNSGKCDINYTGTINYGVLGKYIIEYTAVDDTGNTTTERRVITVNNSAILPIGYTQLKYIESTGDQYINTGYTSSNPNTKFRIDFEYLGAGTTNSWIPICGLRGSEGSKTYYNFFIHQGNLKFSPNYAGYDPAGTGFPILSKNTRYVVENDAGDYKIDGVSYAPTSNVLVNSVTPFYIFAIGSGVNVDNRKAYIRLYSFKLYEGTSLVRDFIPCYRNSDDAIGLCDITSDKFYPNDGTGTFIKGPNV